MPICSAQYTVYCILVYIIGSDDDDTWHQAALEHNNGQPNKRHQLGLSQSQAVNMNSMRCKPSYTPCTGQKHMMNIQTLVFGVIRLAQDNIASSRTPFSAPRTLHDTDQLHDLMTQYPSYVTRHHNLPKLSASQPSKCCLWL